MNTIDIDFNLPSPQQKNTPIEIKAICEEDVLYKFLIGQGGIWESFNEFSEENKILWTPKEDGQYFILVQCKEKNGSKPFDFYNKVSYSVGEETTNFINNIVCDKSTYKIGDKLELIVESECKDLLYRYWILNNGSWEMIKDYYGDNILVFTLNNEGECEILVECKEISSQKKFDEAKTISINVEKLECVEITNFKCLTQDDVIVNRELIFKVDTKQDESRMILYKFYKINEDGKSKLVQDYSSKKIVSFVEKFPGKYKILCMAKDMYSKDQWDDRAIINYEVKPYKDVVIKNVVTDLASPQLRGREVSIKVLAEGGQNLLYKFIIDGNCSVDSGYINTPEFTWKTEYEGEYIIEVFVKDSSFNDQYEASAKISYIVDKEFYIPLRIKDVCLNNKKNYVKNRPINIEVITEGGISPLYNFVIYEGTTEVAKIDFNNCNWLNFTPEKAVEYRMDIKVKDKYSIKEFDNHRTLFFDVKEFIPAKIDYVLLDLKEYYRVDDEIFIEVIAENTRNILLRYNLYINDELVESTDYSMKKHYKIIPRCSGKYTLEALARNESSKKEYDSKKSVSLLVHNSMPITDTEIKLNRIRGKINEDLTFNAYCKGGKDVCYEFYLSYEEQWKRVQRYSKKDFYSFIPFKEGKYSVLVLSKSSCKSVAYEDYNIYEFYVDK